MRPIRPARGPVSGAVRVPGSKSITNRALVLGGLAEGRSVIEGALFSDDTLLMAKGLRALGLSVEADAAAERFTVWGEGGRLPAGEASIDAGNAGTVARFLTAVAALGFGQYVIDGSPRMRERPIGDLVSALLALGTDAEAPSGCPPVLVRARGLAGGKASLRGGVSSQFLSALLLVAPLAESRVALAVDGPLVAAPYVDMTLKMMEVFGVQVERGGGAFRILPQRYRPQSYPVEPDASSASYFFAAAAITGGRVTVTGLRRDSLQGDLGFLDVLERMGCDVAWTDAGVAVRGPERLRGVDVDLNSMSDMTMTLAALAPFAEEPVRIRNVAHIRRQESDRLAALATELRRLGQEVREREDGLEIHPRPVRPAVVQSYGDHRIAMAFAVVGLKVAGTAIDDPACVSKTFPHFLERLEAVAASGP
ncbi:MAG: 3-phosphoshikimate 1-carboxyvinyltransferase [Armatimonadetes bacterium]|nr:3-phosphoshikimate 1-carboxyvinyltransferase [Armatimonadota bacterium]